MKTAVILPLALASVWVAQEAYALSCIPCSRVQAPRVEFGSQDAVMLPANFELRIRGSSTASVTGPGSPALTCTALTVEGDLSACRPAGGFNAGASYMLRIDESESPINFDMAAMDDDVAPGAVTVVSVTERDRKKDNSIGVGPQRGIDVIVTPAEDAAGLTLEMEVTAGGSTRIWAIAGQVDGNGDIRGAIGHGLICQCAGSVDEDDPLLQQASVRIRAVDLAGNAGPWSPSIIPDPDPEAGGCTCASTAQTSAFALLLGLPLLIWRRRNRT